MIDGVTVDIIWIQGTRMPWFDNRLGHLKKKKCTFYICSIYLISYIYIVYILYVHEIPYILYMYIRSKVCDI